MLLRGHNHKQYEKLARFFVAVIFALSQISVLTFFSYTVVSNLQPIQLEAAQGIPLILNYQGKLTNSSGVTVSDGSYDVKISIYDAATAGSCLYAMRGTCAAATAESVTVTSGIFTVQIGDSSDNTLSLNFNDDSYYLGITIGSDSEMTPRKRILSSGYAINADRVDGYSTSVTGGANVVLATDNSGNLIIPARGYFGTSTTSTTSGRIYIDTASTSVGGLIVRGVTSQSANLGTFQNESGTAIAWIGASGGFGASGTSLMRAINADTNNTYDLGSFSNAWRTAYVSDSVRVGTGATSATLSSSGNLTLSGHVLPAANNVSDLGAFGTTFRDIYTSGNVRLGRTSTVSGTLTGSYLGLSSGSQLFEINGNAATLVLQTTAGASFISDGDFAFSPGAAGRAVRPAGNCCGNNNTDLGAYGTAWRNIYASTSLNVSLNANSSSTVSSNGNLTITGSILPASVNSSDLAALGNAFRNLYASTSVNVSSGAASTTVSASGNITTTGHLLSASANSSDLGSLGIAFRSLYASTSLNVSSGAASATLSASGNMTLTGHILPASNNSSDLGAYGTAFNEVYASGTIYADLINVAKSAGTSTIASGLSVSSTFITVYPASNKIGIGTANPQADLHIIYINSNPPRFTSGQNGNIGALAFGDGSNSVGTNVAGTLGFTTNSTEQIRITNAGHLVPLVGSNSIDIGISGAAWRDIYSSGSIRVSNAAGTASTTLSSGNLSLTGHVLPASNAASDLGAFSTAFRNAYVSNTLFGGTVSSTLLTGYSNNAADLGVYTNAFRTLYASTSVIVGTGAGVTINTSGVNVVDGSTSSTLSRSGSLTLTGHVLPASNNASDLGAFGTAFRDAYVSNSLRVGTSSSASSTLSAGSLNITGSLLSASANSSDLGSLGIAFRNLYASTSVNVSLGAASATLSSSGNIMLTGSVLPAVNNGSGQDLGTFGNAWRDVYVSSNVRLGRTSAASGTITGSYLGLSSGSTLFEINGVSATVLLQSGGGASFISDGDITFSPGAAGRAVRPGDTCCGNNNTDLGSFGFAWRNIYASTSINISSRANSSSTISSNGNLTLTGHILPASNNASDLGAFGTAFRDAYVSNSLRVGTSSSASSTLSAGNLNITGHVLSATVNSSDIGSMGIAFRNIYASTSVNVSSGAASTTLGSGNLTLSGLLQVDGSTTSTIASALTVDTSTFLIEPTNNQIAIATTTFFATPAGLTIDIAASGRRGLVVRGIETGAGNLFEGRNSANAPTFWVRTGGAFGSSGTAYLNDALSATNNGFDLGTYGNAWNDIFASGSARFGSMAINPGGADPILFVDDTNNFVGIASTSPGRALDIGSGGMMVAGNMIIGESSSRNVVINAAIGSTLAPTGNNTFDLGSSGLAWRSIYTSGTISIGRGQQGTSTFFHNLAATGTITASCTGTCLDIAEQMTSLNDVVAGDIVEISVGTNFSSLDFPFLVGQPVIERSKIAYSSHVAGIVSTKPGLTILEDGQVYLAGGGGDPRKPAIALAGRVPVKVTDEGGEIKSGDLLVSAPTPGHAMKYDPEKYDEFIRAQTSAAGATRSSGSMPAIIGVALEAFPNNDLGIMNNELSVKSGKILVLVRTGYIQNQELRSKSQGDLSVAQNSTGDIVYKDLDLGGKSILNVKAITSSASNWEINEDGWIYAKEIKTEKLTIQNKADQKTIDKFLIPVGSDSLIVENSTVTEHSRIFLTLRSDPVLITWAVRNIQNGSFEIKLSSHTPSDLNFDYWVINVEE